ncbi:hypothetical protein Prum_043820 [Phytohabitans rumicis]|uniref:Right handed beta helix domain-containing protein n=1 Tax=Phytohabitans rumicis TaxID=1076125 RepID=A0A6V8L5A4_9ACTN|nr:hypothetical protein Prum_043820 [Phytohabitans rumicis]
MRKTILASVAATALTGGALLVNAGPAQAAAAPVLYVRKGAQCTDAGAGTLEQPFCTIGAAAAIATAGQTVDVGGSGYNERVTVANSGTPEQPIVFELRGGTGYTLVGPTAGFVIDGQHDITIKNLRVSQTAGVPALDLRNSSAVAIDGGSLVMASSTTTPAARLTGVTRSTLRFVTISGGTLLPAGLIMDAATSEVTVKNFSLVGSRAYDTADRSVGIQVAGANNTVINNNVNGFTGAAIAVEPGATGTVVANNQITGGAGYGIHNRGATVTAIANNTIRERCLDGVRVDGASSGVSVQNNALILNGHFSRIYCDPAVLDGVEIGVHGDAVKDTVVDYNNATHGGAPATEMYGWNGKRMSLAEFRTVSRQAAHDLETAQTLHNTDSANSAAPDIRPPTRSAWRVPTIRPSPTPAPAPSRTPTAVRKSPSSTRWPSSTSPWTFRLARSGWTRPGRSRAGPRSRRTSSASATGRSSPRRRRSRRTPTRTTPISPSPSRPSGPTAGRPARQTSSPSGGRPAPWACSPSTTSRTSPVRARVAAFSCRTSTA